MTIRGFSRKTRFLLGLLGSVAGQPCPAQNRADQDLVGTWVNVIAYDAAAGSPICHLVNVETRSYQLDRGENGTVSGAYSRTFVQMWLAPKNVNCTIAGSSTLPKPRIDSWQVSGEIDARDVLTVRAYAPDCLGSCNSGAQRLDSFSATLRRRPGGLVDGDDPSNFLLLTKRSEELTDEASAAAALAPLLIPLIKGDCNTFFVQSMHPDARRWLRSDMACKALAPLEEALRDSRYDKSSFSIRLSLGVLAQSSTQLTLFPEGDILVQRAFVVNNDGSLVLVGAVLRKGEGRTWKVVALF